MIGATNTPAAAAGSESLGPRAQLLFTKVHDTKTKVYNRFIQILNEDIELSNAQFLAKHVTSPGQKEIAELDQRTSKIFKQIVVQAVLEIAKNRIALRGLMMISLQSHPKAHAEFFKELALPYVKDVIKELDVVDREIINEATSTDLDPTLIGALQAFSLD